MMVVMPGLPDGEDGENFVIHGRYRPRGKDMFVNVIISKFHCNFKDSLVVGTRTEEVGHRINTR